jgi:hypothetical protein
MRLDRVYALHPHFRDTPAARGVGRLVELGLITASWHFGRLKIIQVFQVQ